MYAFITKTDATRVGREVTFIMDGEIHFGEKDGTISERTKTIASIFENVNMSYKLTSHIMTSQWKKFMINIGMNQVSAVLNAAYGDFKKSQEIIDLTKDAMDEAINVAQARGISIDETDRDKAIDFVFLSVTAWQDINASGCAGKEKNRGRHACKNADTVG